MQKLYNFFLRKYLDKGFGEISRARLILQFCLVTSIFSVFYALVANFIEFQISAKVMPALAMIFFGIAFLLRSKLKLYVISFFYLLFSFSAAMILIWNSGMIFSSITPWLAFIPMAANLLNGKKSAYFWLTISLVAVFLVMYFSPARASIDISYDMKYDKFFFALVNNGLIGIVLILSMIYQKSKDKYLDLLHEKNELVSNFNKELKEKNEEIIIQNKELIEQKEQISNQREFIEIKNRELLNVQNDLNDIIDKLTSTQLELNNREAENQSILNAIYNTQMLVGELNLKGQIVKMNPAIMRFLELDENELIGKSYHEISAKSELKIVEEINFRSLWKKILNGQDISIAIPLKVKGKSYLLKENFFAIHNDKGEVIKVMIVAQDISQIHKQKEKIQALNRELTSKIIKIEQQNVQLVAQRKEIEAINKIIQKSNKEIRDINANLEKRVHERTKNLEEKNIQLAEYAYINSHLLRGPMCSILGLVHLMETNLNKDHEDIVMHMKKSSEELNNVVNKISEAIDKGSHFNREFLSPH
jgi:PAS domain S-box-containing protein